MRAIQMALIVGIVGWSVASFAAPVVDYKPLTMMVEEGDTLEISGFDGTVKVMATPEHRMLSVKLRQINPDKAPSAVLRSLDEWLFSLQKTENKIDLRVSSPLSKRDWRRYFLSHQNPQFELIIKAPSIGLSINWRKGNIEVQGWQAPTQITLLDGQVKTNSTQGPLQVSLQEGQLSVESHEGPLKVDSYAARVRVSDLKGDANIENFMGETDVDKFEGEMDLAMVKGKSRVRRSKGRLEFETSLAPLEVDSFEGDLRGQSEQGSVTANVRGESSVRVTSKKGAVKVRAPGSGAWVNLGTEEGPISAPRHLRTTRLPSLKLLRGRLRGSAKGSIFVRTQSGSINVR